LGVSPRIFLDIRRDTCGISRAQILTINKITRIAPKKTLGGINSKKLAKLFGCFFSRNNGVEVEVMKSLLQGKFRFKWYFKNNAKKGFTPLIARDWSRAAHKDEMA